MDFDRLMQLLGALERHAVEYVLVGGAAVNFHGLARMTDDADLFVRPEADNVERLKKALHSIWSDPAIDEISAEELTGEYPTIRYGPPNEDFVVDLISRLGDAFRFEDLEWAPVPFEGVVVRLATPKTLYRMKKDTVRPKDRGDAELLRRRFNIEEK